MAVTETVATFVMVPVVVLRYCRQKDDATGLNFGGRLTAAKHLSVQWRSATICRSLA